MEQEIPHELMTREYYDSFKDVYEAVWSDQIHTGLFDRKKSLDQAVHDMDEFLASQADIRPGSKIITAGCGSGGPDRFLVKTRQAKVTGIDLSSEQLASAQERAHAEGLEENINYIQGSMTALPVGKETMDCVWLQESFFYCADKPKAIAEFARVLKPDGQVILEDTVLKDPNAKTEVLKLFGKRVHIPDISTPQEYKAWFESNGFELDKEIDLSDNLAETYRHIIDYIKSHTEELKRKLPDFERLSWDKQLGHPESLKLVEQGKLGCVAMVYRKVA